MIMKPVNLLVFLALVVMKYSVLADVTCLDESGGFVDWFVVYKMPRGVVYYYMDANNPQWTLSKNQLISTKQSVAYTLQQVYSNPKDLLHVMYNDEHPDGGKSESSGHTKGVLASDTGAGFWLIHSVPKFPPAGNLSYEYPSTGEAYGQTMMCISLQYKYMDVIGQLFLFNHPSFYDVNIPEKYTSQNPNLVNVTRRGHVKSPPFYHVTSLTSLKGQHFTAFAKYTLFHEDLYEDLVSRELGASLYVETWQNGAGEDLKSNCSNTYKVYNVKGVQLPSTSFPESHDHSKWAVSKDISKNFACIGDINRQVPQLHRGGGTVCIQHPAVHQSFLKTVHDYEHCA